jgi:hypothetical protein
MMMVWTDTAEAGFSIVTASAATRFTFPAFRPWLDATASQRKPLRLTGNVTASPIPTV